MRISKKYLVSLMCLVVFCWAISARADLYINSPRTYNEVYNDTMWVNAQVDMIGGQITTVRVNSYFNLYGGVVTNNIIVDGTAKLYGGRVGGLYVSGLAYVYEGFDGGLNGSPTVLYVSSTGHVDVYGTSLQMYTTGGFYGYGYIDDAGARLFNMAGNTVYSNITLIPEPASLAFLALGALCFRRRKPQKQARARCGGEVGR